uniref:Single domain-containing protein n=1 Tax=Amblyomma cajennense TaxID=34607 RepID=A0A023FPQ9_AMBCJ
MSSVMMKLLLVALSLAAKTVLGEEDKDLHSLEIFEGNCYYRGQTLRNGEKSFQRELCERWECRAKSEELIITGCGLERKYSSCIPRNQAYYSWPKCCHYQNIC